MRQPRKCFSDRPHSSKRAQIGSPRKSGDIRTFNVTAKFEKTLASVGGPPPRLSAHTFEILRSIGLSEAEIEAMRAE